MTGVAGKAKVVVVDPDLLAMSLSNASVAWLLTLVAGDLRAPIAVSIGWALGDRPLVCLCCAIFGVLFPLADWLLPRMG